MGDVSVVMIMMVSFTMEEMGIVVVMVPVVLVVSAAVMLILPAGMLMVTMVVLPLSVVVAIVVVLLNYVSVLVHVDRLSVVMTVVLVLVVLTVMVGIDWLDDLVVFNDDWVARVMAVTVIAFIKNSRVVVVITSKVVAFFEMVHIVEMDIGLVGVMASEGVVVLIFMISFNGSVMGPVGLVRRVMIVVIVMLGLVVVITVMVLINVSIVIVMVVIFVTPVMWLNLPLVLMLSVVLIVMVDHNFSMSIRVVIVMMVDYLSLVMIKKALMGLVVVLSEEVLVDEGVVDGWNLDIVGNLLVGGVQFVLGEVLAEVIKTHGFVLIVMVSLNPQWLMVMLLRFHLKDQVTGTGVGI